MQCDGSHPQNRTMASPALRKLWKLHQIDLALVEVRKRAAALDVGQKLSAELKALQTRFDAQEGLTAKQLASEQHDLELAQKGLDDKLAKIDAQLYGGQVVNPREVENYQKEIAILKRQRDSHDERLLALFDLVPPAKAAAERLSAMIEAKRKELGDRQKAAVSAKASLEREFRDQSAARPLAAKEIDAGLLARYEAIRQRHDGIGMAEILNGTSCSGCGTMLPERTLQAAREDRVSTCETCHRILFLTEGVA